MSDMDTRIRETLDHVASTTRITMRFEEVVQHRSRRGRGWLEAAAAFVVVLLIGLPALLLGGDPEPGTAPPTSEQPSPSTSSVPSTNPTPSTQPDSSAIDPSWLTVDDDDLAVFEQMRAEGESAHSEGWRPSLLTESVWCMYRDGSGVDTSVSSFPIDEDLTLEAIDVECRTENDAVRNLDTSPTQFTFCRGVFGEEAYSAWTTSEFRVVEGSLTAERPGFPVVLGWASDCVSERLDSSLTVRLTTDLSLEDVNRARQIEIAVTGATNAQCFTYEQASTLAKAAWVELGEAWLLTEQTGLLTDLDGACYQPDIDLQWGAVYVGGNDRLSSPGSPPPGTPTTLAPYPGTGG
jgi:hypothetical protein